ncbi:MAG: flagellin [Desulfobacteraceae bacterium]
MDTAVLADDEFEVADAGFTSMSVSSSTTTGTWTIADDGSSVTLSNGDESQAVDLAGDGTQTLDFDQLGIKISLGSDYTAGDLDNLEFDVDNSGQSTFQVGANNVAAEDRITIGIGDATTSALGIDGDNLDLSTISGAQSALDTIDSAIDTLNQERGNIGAYQNRLSFAAANLATTVENVQAAESVIRDVDMAGEMTTFTKNQILMQAGTAMLSQANMSPQQVLSLFG